MTEDFVFEGEVCLQQRVLPAYRTPFFDRLALSCHGGLSVFAGKPRPEESILTADDLAQAKYVPARNLHLLRGPLYLCLQPGILDWLRSADPEALILEANPRCLTNWSAMAWMRRRGRPVLGWGLGAPPVSGLSAGLRRWWRRTSLSRYRALIAYSTLGGDQYRALGFSPELVFVAPNAVSPPPPPLDERPPLEGRPVRVLFVGRLQARKRVDLLLRACAAVEPQPELWVVGDGPARVELERLASRVFPAARFTGALQGEPLEARFKGSDLFVLPGTGGLAVQQAMAHGLPAVVAEGDGTQSDLVAAGNGWLVPPGDLDALIGALREALTDPERLRQMGAASHGLISERVNIDVMTRVFVQALRAVTGD